MKNYFQISHLCLSSNKDLPNFPSRKNRIQMPYIKKGMVIIMTKEKRLYELWKENGAAPVMTDAEISDSFYKELEFGTGGLRGKIGAGTNRMNLQTVGRASLGLANYLASNNKNPSIAIAYDSRKFSKEFAAIAADIMSGLGIKVYLFSALTPTPVLSYAVRKLGASAGIVITASHNPKEYNGYKVYESHGCQITDAQADAIIAEINKLGYFESYEKNPSLINMLGEEMIKDFIKEVRNYSLFPDAKNFAPKIIYTPLHGTGRRPAEILFEEMGLKDITVVEEQREPDCEFTTCPYPNPEEDSALELAYKYAGEKNAELILATDPDADRVGVAERYDNGEIRRFTGNEVGLIMFNYILEKKAKDGTISKNASAVKTVVTTDIGRKIAEKYGVLIYDVLTGFKYIGEKMDTLASPSDYVFGFEESCGYLIGTYARDKDSIGALMLICEAKAYCKSKGITLADMLEAIYGEHGYETTHLQSILFEGQDGEVKKAAVIDKIRAEGIAEICGAKINVFNDYKNGLNGLPKSNVMEFISDNFKFIIRPSGTEPKLKIYYFAYGKTKAASEALVRELVSEVNKLFK